MDIVLDILMLLAASGVGVIVGAVAGYKNGERRDKKWRAKQCDGETLPFIGIIPASVGAIVGAATFTIVAALLFL